MAAIDIGHLDGKWTVADVARGGRYTNYREHDNWQDVLREHDKASAVTADEQTAERLRQDRPNSKKITG